MSVLASKVLAINIVDLPEGEKAPGNVEAIDKDARMNELEGQVKKLQDVVAAPDLKSAYSESSASDSSDSPESSPSLGSADSANDLSHQDAAKETHTKDNEPQSEPKKSNLPSKKTKNDKDAADRVMTIIQSYGHNEPNEEGISWLGREKFDPYVRKYMDADVPIEFVLPAFPWKSVNKHEKVIGAVPDLGEELALGRLQNLCEDITEIYPTGANVTITSDGLVYNDLVGIPDEEVYEYGLALRKMAAEKGYDRLRFIRIMNLLGLTDSPHMTKEEYLTAVPDSRKTLEGDYLPADFDAREAILNDEDINYTYCGYDQFLQRDLRHSPVTKGTESKGEYKRTVKGVAERMITRGKAFARLIEARLPEHVRLSIHRSTGRSKLSFPLVPQPNHFSMTPWHCSILVTADGRFCTAHAYQVRQKADLVEVEPGRPYYFRDRSDVWQWDVPVEFEFFYPRGVYVRPKRAEGEDAPAPKFGEKELAKVKQLSKGFSPVIPLGFA